MKLLLILTTILMLTGCSKASNGDDPYAVIKPTDPDNPVTSALLKGICIFAGQAESFTDADYTALGISPLTDFILIPKEAGEYGSTEEGYKTQLVPFIVKVVNKLIENDKTAKIWIGTPGISSKNFTISPTSSNAIYNYLASVREKLGLALWNNNIAGVYMNMEAIYGTIDYDNLDSNGCIKLASDLSTKIHSNLNTKFLWIPYYGYGTDPDNIIKRIGYVANKTNIFDYIVIQPHYYFDGNVGINIDGVKKSVADQSVCYRDGSSVVAKSSKTVIGAEMELDWHIVSPNSYSEYLSRYNQYASAFSGFTTKYPIIFYWDGTLQKALSGRINPFFNN